jgi:hypothetical protein
MMEKEYIQKLLDSYMAAETTKEEEKLLSDYFSTHRDIPAEWRNYSVMFRSIRQYKQKPDAFHKRTILKWSAAAAVVMLIFGTGLFFLHREEIKVKPTKTVASIPNVSVPQVVELQDEPIIENSVQSEQESLSNTRKHRIRKLSKPTVPMAAEKNEANNRAEENSSIEASTRVLSEHREKMRNNIQATFETPSIFIAENTIEL